MFQVNMDSTGQIEALIILECQVGVKSQSVFTELRRDENGRKIFPSEPVAEPVLALSSGNLS